MGIKIGDIDVASQIIDTEFRVKFLTKLVELLINKNSLNAPSPQEISQIKEETIQELKNKYPNSGIEYKEGK